MSDPAQPSVMSTMKPTTAYRKRLYGVFDAIPVRRSRKKAIEIFTSDIPTMTIME